MYEFYIGSETKLRLCTMSSECWKHLFPFDSNVMHGIRINVCDEREKNQKTPDNSGMQKLNVYNAGFE